MPNILTLRPADRNETAGSYKIAVVNGKRPSLLPLSRQKLAQLAGTSIEGFDKGGHVISDNSYGYKPDLILTGTGSELEIAAKAADELRKEGNLTLAPSLLGLVLKQGLRLDGRSMLEAKARQLGLTAPAGRIYKEFWHDS